ncbi:sensor histidine kinase [Methylobacterium haplocladii]|nr:sensor histidine kinase [Methylobacterium haplocladii]GJD84330.1 hypothetical protein HPGCJGGD_2206 [Methylobacterium haplocladii]
MTDRLDKVVFARAPSNAGGNADGVLVDLASTRGDPRAAGLERDLAALRTRLQVSEQAHAVLLARYTQQRLMVNELAHRLKNSLALVQAMVRQVLREPVCAEEARESLTARIVALGQTQGLLIEERHAGAGVARIVETALTPHLGGEPDRVHLAGPAVRLGPGQALALSMALHELATNAVKYGALSVERGRVEVAWRTYRDQGRRRFALRWSEHDGPNVAPPTRRGFGSRLIERSLADAFGGEVEWRPEPGGMVCRINALVQPMGRGPQAALRASRKAACSAARSPSSALPINARVSGTP